MGILDMFKKKKGDDFMDLGAMGAPGAPGGFGPAGMQGMQGMPGEQPMGQPFGQQPGMQGMGGLPPMPDMGQFSGPQQMQQPMMQQMPQMASPGIDDLRRAIETLSYKLDALKAGIDSINSRLANIEAAFRATPTEGRPGEGWQTV